MKSSKLIFYILATVVLVLVIVIARESFFQPGMARFEGKFEELGHYRNENNTGPVLRVYAVKVLDKNQDWMREYGDALPHTKYGKTLVFYFSDELDQKVQLGPKEPYFPQDMVPHVIATYQKSPMGEVSFTAGYQK